MKRLLLLFAFLTVGMPAGAADAQAQVVDDRIDLRLTADERSALLAEMRQMLASIQGILQGIGEGDRERIAESARQSGNGPTHMMFEELAVRAETDDMDTLAGATAVIMNQCLSCHATFRAQ